MQTEAMARFAYGLASANSWCAQVPFPSEEHGQLATHFQVTTPRPRFKEPRRFGDLKEPRAFRERTVAEALADYLFKVKEPATFIKRITDVLELQLFSLVVFERAFALGIKTFRELRGRALEISEVAHHRVASDGWRRCVQACAASGSGVAPDGALPDLTDATTRCESMLRLPELQTLRDGAGLAGAKERTRLELVLVALGAFVSRQQANSPRHRIAGELFEAGKIDVAQVASILETSIPDALVFLDDNGYRRPVSRQLEDQDAVFANLERLQAAGTRWWDTPELARRDALSTQRIESIDARSH